MFAVGGMALVIVGFFLTPFVIGIPIMIMGFLIGTWFFWYGIFCQIIKIIPGGEAKASNFKKIIIESYKPYFRRVKP